MTSNRILRVTELDFDTIKANLKTFLQSQTEFTDYNFDGAGLSVLLDVLAYNNHYSAMTVHLMANEMFIDTAIKRASIVSIAKTLGYIPRSVTGSRAKLKLVVTSSLVSPPATMTIDTNVKFTATVNSTPYTFNVLTPQTVTGTAGVYTFNEVDVIEGVRLSNTFTAASDTLSGPFVIPISTIDLSTLIVSVRGVETLAYTRSTSIIDVGPTSKVYWVEENMDGNYQIIFGDSNPDTLVGIGLQLEAGNVVTVSYIASSGSSSNSARSFTLVGSVATDTTTVVTTVEIASAGSEKESVDSVRFNAPKYNATRNRAVTAQDYKSLILASLDKVQSVAVWGGEENIPPMYGKVFITLDPKAGYAITDADHSYISSSILRPRGVMSIQHEFVDPEYLYLGFDIAVSYNPNITNFTANQISALVLQAAGDFFETNLSTLDKTFFYSQFIDALAIVNPSIVGVLADMTLQHRITSTASFNTTKALRYLGALQPGSIHSTAFVSLVNDISYDAYIQDFADDNVPNLSGTGTLKLLQYMTGTVLVPNLGTVNYGTGVLSFSDLSISEYLGGITDVRITTTPQNMSKNVSPTVISMTPTATYATLPMPARNIIIELDDSEINEEINLAAGITVTTTPYTEVN